MKKMMLLILCCAASQLAALRRVETMMQWPKFSPPEGVILDAFDYAQKHVDTQKMLLQERLLLKALWKIGVSREALSKIKKDIKNAMKRTRRPVPMVPGKGSESAITQAVGAAVFGVAGDVQRFRKAFFHYLATHLDKKLQEEIEKFVAENAMKRVFRSVRDITKTKTLEGTK